jgi:hypothetical protein
MPYGTPTPDTYASTYNITATHIATGVHVVITSGGDFDEADKDAAFQAVVDLVSASLDFELHPGTKAYPTLVGITPTP